MSGRPPFYARYQILVPFVHGHAQNAKNPPQPHRAAAAVTRRVFSKLNTKPSTLGTSPARWARFVVHLRLVSGRIVGDVAVFEVDADEVAIRVLLVHGETEGAGIEALGCPGIADLAPQRLACLCAGYPG